MGLIENMIEGMSGGHGLTTPVLAQAMRGVIGTGDSPGPGLPALLEKLEKAGLGPQVRTWAAAGAGSPITGAQLRAALGDSEVAAMAARAGIAEDAFVAKLSEHLPGIVHDLWRQHDTPDAVVNG